MKGIWLTLLFLVCTIVQKAQVVTEIEFTGNKKTKEIILKRELTFELGDTVLAGDTVNHISESENNLFNTTLFNFTDVKFISHEENWKVVVTLQERWYLWPEVMIKFQERNFSEWWKNKNLSRIDLGLHLNKYNFLGLNQNLQVNGYVGFTEKFGFQYRVPYLTKKMRDGLKVAADYSTQNEVFVGVSEDEMVYIKNDSLPIRSAFRFQLEYFRRTGFYQTQYFTGRFIQIQAADTLKDLSQAYLGNQEGFLRFAQLTYRFKYDRRFTQNYPLRGFFVDLQIDQYGLGQLDKSDLSVTRVLGSYRFYRRLANRQYWATGFHINQYLGANSPFLFQSGLGFNDYVRGFEPNVIFGRTSFLVKNNYKFQIVRPKKYTLPLIKKIKRFSKIHFAIYGNVIFDAGYVQNPTPINNTLNNKLLYGSGLGLDWVTYYDVVVRTEYLINQFGQTNFNLSFVAPI